MEKILTAELFINVLLQDATSLFLFFFSQLHIKLIMSWYTHECFYLVSSSFTWHIKFLNPLVIPHIHEDIKNLHPVITFLVWSQCNFGTFLYAPKLVHTVVTTEVALWVVSEAIQVSEGCQCGGSKAERGERPQSKTFRCLPEANSSM